jgi:P2 phage tail completion protein R (GpR).
MNKPDSLRQHLLDAIPDLAKNPSQLLVFIDDGNVRCTATHGLSFEYSYTLNLIFTDYAGHLDAIAVPLLAWLRVNQNELLANLEKGKQAIQFEADILDNTRVDLSITLPLTERIIAKETEGNIDVTHAPEPPFTDQFPADHWVVRDAQGNIIAEWDSIEPTGALYETPHPGPSNNPVMWMGVEMTGDD